MELELHWWAESGQLDRLREALAAGADPEERDDEGRTALQVAVATGAVDAVRTLLEGGADTEAAEEASPNYRPLHRACVASEADARERADILAALLEHGVDVTARDGRARTVLHLAIPWCTSEFVDALLARGADAAAADASGRTPMHTAASRGADSLTDLLLGDDGELSTSTPIRRADSALARLDDRGILEALVAAGASVDAADAQGVTPLHIAAEQGTATVVVFLLANGAEFLRRDEYEVTPLHRASSADIAGKLLDAGATVDPADHDGRTPLHRALAGGRLDVAELLLRHGALAGIADREGRTPLHEAATAGRAHAVEQLLDAGADPSARDSDGRTPLDWARTAGHSLVADTLKRRGGKGRRFPFFR